MKKEEDIVSTDCKSALAKEKTTFIEHKNVEMRVLARICNPCHE